MPSNTIHISPLGSKYAVLKTASRDEGVEKPPLTVNNSASNLFLFKKKKENLYLGRTFGTPYFEARINPVTARKFCFGLYSDEKKSGGLIILMIEFLTCVCVWGGMCKLQGFIGIRVEKMCSFKYTPINFIFIALSETSKAQGARVTFVQGLCEIEPISIKTFRTFSSPNFGTKNLEPMIMSLHVKI